MNIFDKLIKYLIGSYSEMKKVSWPTKKQTTNYSLLVIGLSIGTAIFFVILDYIFNFGIEKLLIR